MFSDKLLIKSCQNVNFYRLKFVCCQNDNYICNVFQFENTVKV